ncbi:MAG: hypothetical protein P8099_08585 [Gemmatimonadota bacterium]|jgi:hypothetical protein
MRIALDPVPLVLGVYAYVGQLLSNASRRTEAADPKALARRFAGGRGQPADQDVRKMVKTVHADVKTADKLLKKTADVWKISQETDLVELVVQGRDEEFAPQAYVLLRPDDVRALLRSIGEAAEGAGEGAEVVEALANAASSVEGKPNDYITFGFHPWSA